MKNWIKWTLLSITFFITLIVIFMVLTTTAAAVSTTTTVTQFSAINNSDGTITITGHIDAYNDPKYDYYVLCITDEVSYEWMTFRVEVEDNGDFQWKFDNPWESKQLTFDLDQYVCKAESWMPNTTRQIINQYGEVINNIYYTKFSAKATNDYLGPSVEFNLEGEELDRAIQEIDQDRSNKSQGEKIYSYLISHVDYSTEVMDTMNNEPWDFYRNPEFVLSEGEANCGGFANCFAALGRHYNIPTKVIIGTLAISNLQTSGVHAWNEIWDEKSKKWIVVDCCNKYNGYNFKYSPTPLYGDNSKYKMYYEIYCDY